MRIVRRLHLYLSCFFAPLLLFYVGTGWYQTLNKNRTKSPAEATELVQKLRSVHVDQLYPTEAAQKYSTAAFNVLVVVMSISLITTIGLGIYLAFRTTRQPWPVLLAILGGFVLPVLLLWLGQKR